MFHLLRLAYDMGKKLVLELMTNKLKSASQDYGCKVKGYMNMILLISKMDFFPPFGIPLSQNDWQD